MTIPVFQVDAFTDRPFAGNPAAVCLLPEVKDDGWMQSVAAEMNLSETAFLLKQDDGYRLRWFTPVVEVDLCGHATLASAHVIWSEGHALAEQELRFHTRSGLLKACRRGNSIELDFPAAAVTEMEPSPELLPALGVKAIYVGKTPFDYLVEIESEEELERMTPNFTQLGRVDTRGVIVTCRSKSTQFDFLSRFFAPAAGIDEDPVTGSAHCALGPYWQTKLGKTELTGYQASPRGGVVHVRVANERAYLGGNAVTVLRGELAHECEYIHFH